MAIFRHNHHTLTLTLGILGNIISLMVYLAPAPTFHRIIKKKSTEGFQSIPYVVALFSSTIWIYYATLKTDAMLLIIINVVGCVIETFYISIYIAYAPKNVKIQTTKLVVSLNLVGFWVIALLTHYLAEGRMRVEILGWICLVISIAVFAAPLSIMVRYSEPALQEKWLFTATHFRRNTLIVAKRVIRTQSVEFMSFGLSFFLACSAVMWFLYGLLQNDFYVALPNIIGFMLGVVQMVLYFVYKDSNKKKFDIEEKLPVSTSTLDEHPIYDAPKKHDANQDRNKNINEKIIVGSNREAKIEARNDEPAMTCATLPIDELIYKDVMKDDMILKASTSCTSIVHESTNAIEDYNIMKNMEATKEVYLIESAA